MGAKGKKKSKRGSPTDLFHQAERAFTKRQFKDALKDAKVCYRSEPSDRHRKLLERAYLARADELFRSGLPDQGRAVLDELQALGVTEPAVKQQLPDMLLRAGLLDERKKLVGHDLTAEERAELEMKAADNAVLNPKGVPSSMPSIREGALKVRKALETLEAGDEAQALALLQDVPRSSPFADWKLLVRGLAAYYRGNSAEMLANWDRLDAQRRAVRIAGPLKQLAAGAGGGDDEFYRASRLLETGTTGFQTIALMRELERELARGDWRAVLSVFRRVRSAFRRVDRDLLDRIVRVIADQLIRTSEVDVFDQFAQAADPPADDPHWNRARALLWELADEGEFDLIDELWSDFVDDLQETPGFSDAERKLAQGMVLARLGRHAADQYNFESKEGWYDGYGEDEDEEDLQERALRYYRDSLEAAPELAATYRDLAEYQQEWGQPDAAAETYRRLLEHHPDELDAVTYLCGYHWRKDESLRALDYALQARRIKPLDERVTVLAWLMHLEAARHYAVAGEWDKGREEFARADKIAFPDDRGMPTLVRRGLFEWKAGHEALAREFLSQAEQAQEEPTPALLLTAIEAARYGMPKDLVRQFNSNWKKLLKKKCNSQTAALMCKQVSSYLKSGVQYTWQRSQVQNLFAYMRRMSRVKFREEDLRVICDFIGHHSDSFGKPQDDVQVYKKYVKKGLRNFPESPYFLYWAAILEIQQGPYRANRRYAFRCLQQARELAEKSNRPEDVALRKPIKERLTFLDQVGLEPMHSSPFEFEPGPDGPAPGGGPLPMGAPNPQALVDMIVDMADKLGLDPDAILDDLEQRAAAEGKGRRA